VPHVLGLLLDGSLIRDMACATMSVPGELEINILRLDVGRCRGEWSGRGNGERAGRGNEGDNGWGHGKGTGGGE